MDSRTRLRVNTDEIAAEVIEAETVLINLSTGTYYTMDNVGSVVWSMIERSCSLAEMSEALEGRYSIDRERASGDLRQLATSLLDQGLVVVDEVASEAVPKSADPVPDDGPYEPPKLHSYTDMAEVLALDPPLPVLKE